MWYVPIRNFSLPTFKLTIFLCLPIMYTNCTKIYFEPPPSKKKKKTYRLRVHIRCTRFRSVSWFSKRVFSRFGRFKITIIIIGGFARRTRTTKPCRRARAVHATKCHSIWPNLRALLDGYIIITVCSACCVCVHAVYNVILRLVEGRRPPADDNIMAGARGVGFSMV